MGRGLRWLIPAGTVGLGFALLVVGLVYDLVFAGIPYQDPTPETETRWRFHSGVASVIELTGCIVALLGLTAFGRIVLWSLVKGGR